MTITKTNNAEGGTNSAAVTTGNSGGSSGNAWDLVSNAPTYDTASAVHGSLGYKITPTSGSQCLMRWTGFNDATGVLRAYRTDSANPAAQETVIGAYTSTGVAVIGVGITAAGKYAVQNGSAATNVYVTTASRQAGDRIELSWTVGTTTGNGAWTFSLFRGDATGTPTETTSSSTANLGTTNWDRVQFGKLSSSTWTAVTSFDDLAAASGTTAFFGPPSLPPTAAFTSNAVALAATFDGTSSTAVSPATISCYAWDFGDAGTGTGATPSHTYAAAGTYNVTLTVTDSNSNTASVTNPVTVAAASGTVTVQAVNVSTGWTASSGTVLSCLTDADPTTFDTSNSPPTAQELDFTLQAVIPVASGQPFKVFLTMDSPLSTSASLAAQLFEGATQRSSLTGVTIPVGSGSSVTGTVTLTFPWTDVQNITTGGWNALKVKLQVTAA